MTLGADDFEEFYEETHLQRPFAWQIDLTRQVLATRAWPDEIDVPTGLGKTALLDIAVFACAVTAHDAPWERLGRRRMFLVVDRRIVVDQAYERAQRIALSLELASEPGSASYAVAQGLRALAPDAPTGTPLLPVTRMRGGTTWAASWVDRPDLPTIVTGTVDQVGSRLLFRGYGVSSQRQPMDAALVGNDSLLLIDEAHLASALCTTIRDTRLIDIAALPVPATTIVQLSATRSSAPAHDSVPTGVEPWIYRLDEQMHQSAADPTAWNRLTAPKRLRGQMSSKANVVNDVAKEAYKAAEISDSERVLVVCNTVDRARAVFAKLQKASVGATVPTRIDLLIGRSRSVERSQLVPRLMRDFAAGRERQDARGRAVLVATQTVEVGVDLDANSLVTESASWDALVQRFGRVNRLGLQRTAASVVVVHDGEERGPVYGAARDVTWKFLEGLALDSDSGLTDGTPISVDVSPLACRRLTETAAPPDAYLSSRPAPWVSSVHLDAWARTNPAPANDIPLDQYLHGLGAASPAVSLVWRDGLAEEIDGEFAETDDNRVDALLTAVPIRPEELVEVPLAAARRWMSGEVVPAVSDVEGAGLSERPVKSLGESFWCVVTRSDFSRDDSTMGEPSWRWIQADHLRPGDVAVVPTNRGGLDAYGWAPQSRGSVSDVSEIVALRGGHPILRFDRSLPTRLGLGPEDSLAVLKASEDLRHDLDAGLEAGDAGNSLARLVDRMVISALTPARSAAEEPADDALTVGAGWTRGDLDKLHEWLSSSVDVVDLENPVQHGHSKAEVVLLVDGSSSGRTVVERGDGLVDGSSHSAAPVTLTNHHTNVGSRARGIADALGLPPEIIEVTVDAARWHDLGKCDPRFQAMLHDGDRLRAELAPEPLAKSGMPSWDRARRRAATIRSEMPRGARHESWSEAVVGSYLTEHHRDYPGDVDLLLHLIASHHGHARPFLPPVPDSATHQLVIDVDGVQVSAQLPHGVDLESASRFRRLNQRYGRWGLALLETVVRSADMTVSGEGS